MIPEGAWSLVPKNMPPDLAGWIRVAGQQTNRSESREFRALCWADYILRQLGIDAAWALEVSAGFVPFRQADERSARIAPSQIWKEREGDEYGYAFGAVIGQREGFPSPFVAFVDPRFPVVVETRRPVLDAPPHPAGSATSTCYARAQTGKRFPCGYLWSEGVVTAQHVITAAGHGAGSAVSMIGASSMTVVDIDPATTIDAAILDCGTGGIPASAANWPAATLILPGDKVDVSGTMTSFTADVLRVFEHPTYFGNMFGQRVFIDNVGVAGDSGAPASLVAGGDAVGIYMGRTGTTPDEGIVQHIRQVMQYFEVDLYR